ncbi:MAG: undecaprenyldiphospho-muramoylpentapeptide beta-N-acetylglucosaminyltransferase [Candidatus Omnitrophica bacterium]|nr:undecaprenyldiphospho-muramoylpentapeptide beta-N-acetylglucosaminyltransferase [Candidatus Omnitrophota bacterium]
MAKIVIATGGTGGHIYPGLVTAEELRRRNCEVVFIGVLGMAEEKIRAAGFDCVSIEAKGFVSKGVADKIKSLCSMVVAFFRCWRILMRLRPSLVLGFGGYSSFPVVLAAFFSRVPVMLHEQNAIPGAANKILAKMAVRVAVGFKEAMSYFPAGKAVWTGNPLRGFDMSLARDKAIEDLGLDLSRRTVLVFGGSQGSRKFNKEVVEAFAVIPGDISLQVIHITGRHDFIQVKERYAALGVRALVREYMDRIETAYAAADLVIGRAGAGTVMETGLWAIPSVLIPFPGARDHQKYNARVLERLGLAVIIEEKCLRQDILRDKIFAQIKHNTSSVYQSTERERLKEFFIPNGADRLSDEVLKVAHD